MSSRSSTKSLVCRWLNRRKGSSAFFTKLDCMKSVRRPSHEVAAEFERLIRDGSIVNLLNHDGTKRRGDYCHRNNPNFAEYEK